MLFQKFNCLACHIYYSLVAKQNGEFIRIFILSFDSPKMVESVDYPYKLHIL
jgi:hypothetical protein